MNETAWESLCGELDEWRRAGRVATLWWRDDDAVTATGALERLLGSSRVHRVPLGLAVIPAGALPALARSLESCPGVRVLQHGYRHRNHAPAGEKSSELGPYRLRERILDDIRAGFEALGKGFERWFLPVLVPPWNRIDPALAPALAGVGLRGLSTYRARPSRLVAPGVVQANCHVDIVNWRGDRGFVGIAAGIRAMTAHLADRRLGRVDAHEPTGLLTHHLDHDEGCFDFVDALLARTAAHPGARWIGPAEAFGE